MTTMQNTLAVRHEEQALAAGQPLTAAMLKARVQLIQQVMKGVMKLDTHYGSVTGKRGRPVLLKPGAEVLMATFQIAADPLIEDLSTDDVVKYRVVMRGLSPAGEFLGAGAGTCSSNEAKYKWRAALCEPEFDDTPEDRRRRHYKEEWTGGQGNRHKEIVRIQQVRTEPADLDNTILKMAVKRALVAMALVVTAASDIFDQDLDPDDPGAPPATPEPKAGNRATRQRMGNPKDHKGEPRSPNAPDPDAAGDGEARDEEEVKAMIAECEDITDLNYVTGLIGTVPESAARARLRKLGGTRAQFLAQAKASA